MEWFDSRGEHINKQINHVHVVKKSGNGFGHILERL
jgi:hypothetical protein